MAFCFRVLPKISLMGKEIKILFPSEIRAPVKHTTRPLDVYKPGTEMATGPFYLPAFLTTCEAIKSLVE